MTIDELISDLGEVRKKNGNLDVFLSVHCINTDESARGETVSRIFNVCVHATPLPWDELCGEYKGKQYAMISSNM